MAVTVVFWASWPIWQGTSLKSETAGAAGLGGSVAALPRRAGRTAARESGTLALRVNGVLLADKTKLAGWRG